MGRAVKKESNYVYPQYMSQVNMKRQREGRRERGRQAFDLDTNKSNFGWGLIGEVEDKWQSKSWELCPNMPTTNRGTPKEALHACCSKLCSSQFAQPLQWPFPRTT